MDIMEETSEFQNSLPDYLKRAGNRVINNEGLMYLKAEQKIRQVIDSEIYIKSMEILERRELDEAPSNRKQKDLNKKQLQEEKIRLREERDQLHKVLVRHKSLHSSLLQSCHDAQIQNAVYDSLKNNSVVSPEIGQMMTTYQENLTLCSKLADTLRVFESDEEKVLRLRCRYRILLRSIEEKWKHLSGLNPVTSNAKSENADSSIASSVEKRRDRLQLLVSLLQNLISMSGEKWGSNKRIVEIMLLCDKVRFFLGGFGTIFPDLEGLHLARDQRRENQVNRTQGPLDEFISSTPK